MIHEHSEETMRSNFDAMVQALVNGELKIFQSVELATGRMVWLIALLIETDDGMVVVPLGELFDRPRPSDFQLITTSGNGAVN